MIEVAILKNFDSGTYKAGVQLAGSFTTYFDDVSVAKNIPSSALVIGNYVILVIPGGNPKDACVIATWPGGAGYFLDLSDTPSSYSGQAGKYLRVNAGETALEYGLALDAHKLRHDWLGPDELNWRYAFLAPSRLLLCNWQVADYWTQAVTGSGSVSVGILNTQLVTGTTDGSTASIYTTARGFNMIDGIACFAGNEAEDPTDCTVWLCMTRDTTPSDTGQHAGFKIINGRIWASCGDGSNQTIVDTGVDLARFDDAYLYVVGAPDQTYFKFYRESTLLATITTNLPPFNDLRPLHYIVNSAAVQQRWRSYQFMYVW
jgi:hypothetical protein